MALNHLQNRQLAIGFGVGLTAMVICAGLMFLLLVFRRRYLDKDDKYLQRGPMTNGFPTSIHSGNMMDMSRSMAWSNRQGFRRSVDRGPALADSPYDPTLRPLHGQNDPFFHRDRHDQYNGSPRGTYSSHSDHQSGAIAIVPFRESQLPVAPTSFSQDGRLRTNGRLRSGWEGNFPGARQDRSRTNPVEASVDLFADDLLDPALSSDIGVLPRARVAERTNRDRQDPLDQQARDTHQWRRGSTDPWYENRSPSSRETSESTPLRRGERGDASPPGRGQVNLSSDTSHLDEVYY